MFDTYVKLTIYLLAAVMINVTKAFNLSVQVKEKAGAGWSTDLRGCGCQYAAT